MIKNRAKETAQTRSESISLAPRWYGGFEAMGAGIDLDKAEALINAGQIPDAVPILEKFVARKPRESRALQSC